MLRSGASRARRDPSPILRSKVQAAIEAGGHEADREPVAGPSRRGVLVAAAILVAIGLGVFAFFQPVGGSAPPSGVVDRAASNPAGSPASPPTFASLARTCPRALRTAVDDPLLAELADIAEDATRTVRFLAGRVPASLVPRGVESSGR
jgi:hypothetical protein